MRQLKIIIEKHTDGYVAYPVGVRGVVVGEGDTYAEALRDVQSALRFHVESFELVREREHMSLQRRNADGSVTPLTMPNHSHLKGSTLRAICRQSDINRDDFLKAFEES